MCNGGNTTPVLETQKEILGPLEYTYIFIWEYTTNILFRNVWHNCVHDNLADDVWYCSIPS